MVSPDRFGFNVFWWEDLNTYKAVVDCIKIPKSKGCLGQIPGCTGKPGESFGGNRCGSALDVFFCDTHLLSSLVKKRVLVNLAPFIKEVNFNPADYFPAAWSGCLYPGRVFGLPCYWGENAIAYNKNLFDKAKIAYPEDDWSWDEFLKIAQELTLEKAGKTIQYGATSPSLDPHFVGRNWFDERGRFVGDDREIKGLCQFIQNPRIGIRSFL